MPKKLADLLIGDLGVAMRHLSRIQFGELQASPAVISGIRNSIMHCIDRIELSHDAKEWETE